jgi:GMP synthase-like glutamine amidotransferase
MRALIVSHDHLSPPGLVGERLTFHGYELVRHVVVPATRFGAPGVEPRFPDFTAFDAVVVLGAPWSAYDPLVASWVPAEIDQLRRADAAGVPVLGICFGGQLLAVAHGGSVARSPVAEIGWHSVSTDEPAVVPAGPWFEWHYDRWTVPVGGVEIARNSAASQAFMLRRNLAVQFHPEITVEVVAAWLAHGGEAQAVAAGMSAEGLVASTRAAEGAGRERAFALVDAFVRRG